MLRPPYRSLCAKAFAGNKCTCNICGHSFCRMRPVYGRRCDGTPFIAEDSGFTCWKCMSYPRTRSLWLWLTGQFGLQKKPELKILHVAPEKPLADRSRRLQNVDYTAIDKKCPGYRYPGYVKDGDIAQLEFADNSFDIVICNHVLEQPLFCRARRWWWPSKPEIYKSYKEFIRLVRFVRLVSLVAPIVFNFNPGNNIFCLKINMALKIAQKFSC